MVKKNRILMGTISVAVAASGLILSASAASAKDNHVNSIHGVTINANSLIKQPRNIELTVQEVELLTPNSRYLQVTFNKPVYQLERFQFKVIENNSNDVMGTEEVRLNKSQTSAVIILYKGNTLETGKPYTLSFEHNGQVQQIKFEHYNYYEDGYVTSANANNRKIKLSGVGTLNVSEDLLVDFQQMVGQRIRAWYDSSDILRRMVMTEDPVLYDGMEVGSKIKLVTSGKKYKVTADTTLYVNGKETEFSAYNGQEFPYAKLVLNEDGDAAFVYAYTWATEPIIIEKVKDNIVYGLGGEKLDISSYIILKNTKPISVSDFQVGDILYFNEDAKNVIGKRGVGEIYNRSVTGKITQIYHGDSFEVNGKVYDCIGDIFGARVLDGRKLEDFRENEAERLEGKEVTLHFSRNGDLVYVQRASRGN
ncbi:hypothetical protein [Bacillus sp. V5-8f]|uniref:hypothetical protein n=1 Tax=Bacillus sp. V5-8f TaxID=2053044 RepID=UPI000C784B28|nr:hypothetical protein [Bacillus sp. V5-8f]PLT32043.1 hypothetical protein CUU64_20945 [Bacillus sp. V5-8f]